MGLLSCFVTRISHCFSLTQSG